MAVSLPEQAQHDPAMMTLTIENISKSYGPLEVLRGISLELQAGENIAVVGPSGSGKSTLLSLIGTLETPSDGRVLLEGRDLSREPEPQLATIRGARIGFVFQEHFLLPHCSVVENVLLPALAHGGVSGERMRRADMLLEAVGLAERRDHRPAELSGGERQRASLARALLLEPRVVLADEPTGNLDARRGRQIGELLLDLQRREDFVLIVATHSEALAGMLSRRLALEEGVAVPMSFGDPP